MNLEHISLERLQQIEEERAQTQLDPEFQSWIIELNVSKLCINRDGIIRANQMMQDWKMNSLNKIY